jgi:hypothetical protein
MTCEYTKVYLTDLSNTTLKSNPRPQVVARSRETHRTVVFTGACNPESKTPPHYQFQLVTIIMISASPLLTDYPSATPKHDDWSATCEDIWSFAEQCLNQTAIALREVHAASPSELSLGMAAARKLHAEGTPADLLEQVARIQGYAGEHLSGAIFDLGNKVAGARAIYQPVIPFVSKLIAPSSFYDSYDHLHKIARVLLSPVIYAEETDAIGIASVNPIAAIILTDEIRKTVLKRCGIRPFITTSRLDYENWTILVRKHFEL